jgi:hypothetical protein
LINELNKIINDSDDPTFIGENIVKFFLDDGNLLFDHYIMRNLYKLTSKNKNGKCFWKGTSVAFSTGHSMG